MCKNMHPSMSDPHVMIINEKWAKIGSIGGFMCTLGIGRLGWERVGFVGTWTRKNLAFFFSIFRVSCANFG